MIPLSNHLFFSLVNTFKNNLKFFLVIIVEGYTSIDIFLFIELNRVRGKTTKLLNNLGENFLLENFNIFIFSVTSAVNLDL
jgi:hypothetical protein